MESEKQITENSVVGVQLWLNVKFILSLIWLRLHCAMIILGGYKTTD